MTNHLLMQIRTIIAVSFVITLASCGTNQSSKDQRGATASAADILESADSTSFSSDVASLTSPSRKIIRTADLRCRVTDVFRATTELERLVTSLGGIVQQSEMRNDVSEVKTLYYKPDSVQQTQTYATTSSITLRVPAALIDSVVATIPQLSSFVDHRTLSQSDVTLSYLGNALRNKASEEREGVSPGALAKETGDAIDANEYEEQKENEQISRRIENLNLLDQANYATITVAFYQPQQVSSVVVVNPDHFTQPAFHLQVLQALQSGLQILSEIFLFFLQFWTIWLLAVTGWLVYRKYKGRFATAANMADIRLRNGR
jgi:hypothetical protein